MITKKKQPRRAGESEFTDKSDETFTLVFPPSHIFGTEFTHRQPIPLKAGILVSYQPLLEKKVALIFCSIIRIKWGILGIAFGGFRNWIVTTWRVFAISACCALSWQPEEGNGLNAT